MDNTMALSQVAAQGFDVNYLLLSLLLGTAIGGAFGERIGWQISFDKIAGPAKESIEAAQAVIS